MTSRSRPRGQIKDELDEEQTLWNDLRSDAKRIDQLTSQTSFMSDLGVVGSSSDQTRPRTVEEEIQEIEEGIRNFPDSTRRTRRKLYVKDPGTNENDQVDAEAQRLWSMIRKEGQVIDQLIDQQNKASKKIVEFNEQQTALVERGQPPSATIDEGLEKALRENIRLGEEITELGGEMTEKIQVLSALRTAPESDPVSNSRSASVGKSQRDRQTKRKLTDTIDDRDSIAADSPGGHSSPKVMVPGKDRLKAMSTGSRAGSVPAGRDSSVKPEDTDGQDPAKASERNRLSMGNEVLYRNNKSRSVEGEGILCRVTSVIGEGKQRRYEIIDADPDPPVPAQPYRASVNHLAAIPPTSANFTLPELKIGRPVLAMYPGTTTFYKAEVVAPWTAKKEIKEEGKDQPENLVRLRFEGEDEADREMSVERRYVLPDK